MSDTDTPSRFLVSAEWVAARCAEAAAEATLRAEKAEAERDQLRDALRGEAVHYQMRADSAEIQVCDVCDAWDFPDNDDGWELRFKHKPSCVLATTKATEKRLDALTRLLPPEDQE